MLAPVLAPSPLVGFVLFVPEEEQSQLRVWVEIERFDFPAGTPEYEYVTAERVGWTEQGKYVFGENRFVQISIGWSKRTGEAGVTVWLTAPQIERLADRLAQHEGGVRG